jgi:L-ascorbate metabolism protein UlaG (beta-lactamase superfamily)
MDDDFSFLITADGHRLCTDPGERPRVEIQTDVLFLFPLRQYPYYKSLMPRVKTKVVIPTHWDDFFRPLSRPLRPQMKYPALAFPPIQRVNLAGFSRMIKKLSPQTKVLIPEIFRSYNLAEVESGGRRG